MQQVPKLLLLSQYMVNRSLGTQTEKHCLLQWLHILYRRGMRQLVICAGEK